jgi:hypothetical protein
MAPSSHDELLTLLADAMRTGTELDLADGNAISDEQMPTWGANRTVSTDELQDLLLRDMPRSSRGLRVRGLRVVGPKLQLSHQQLDFGVLFQSCIFECPIAVVQTKITMLIFRGCLLDSVTADRIVCPMVTFDCETPSHGTFELKSSADRATRIRCFVRMKQASISYLSFRGARFGPEGDASGCGTVSDRRFAFADILLEGSSIRDFLDLQEVSAPGFVDLSRVTCGELRLGRLDDGILNGSPFPRLGLRDLSYSELIGDPQQDVAAGLRLLAGQAGPVALTHVGPAPDPTLTFMLQSNYSFQPYTTLADYYSKVGEDAFARKVRMRSAALRSKRRDVPGDSRLAAVRNVAGMLGRRSYGLVAGYGYRPSRILGAFAVLMILTYLVVGLNAARFTSAQAANSQTVTQSVTGPPAPPKGNTPPPAMSQVDAFLYAVSNDMPALGAVSTSAWKLDSTAPGWLMVAMVLFRIVGLLFTTIALGAIAGLLKKI